MRAADLFLGCFMFWKLFWPNKESKLMGIYIVLRRPARAKTALGIALRRKQRGTDAHTKKSANFRLTGAKMCFCSASCSRGKVCNSNYFSEKTHRPREFAEKHSRKRSIFTCETYLGCTRSETMQLAQSKKVINFFTINQIN
jgi:hypothetical protein